MNTITLSPNTNLLRQYSSSCDTRSYELLAGNNSLWKFMSLFAITSEKNEGNNHMDLIMSERLVNCSQHVNDDTKACSHLS